jgi:hypothetical protein
MHAFSELRLGTARALVGALGFPACFSGWTEVPPLEDQSGRLLEGPLKLPLWYGGNLWVPPFGPLLGVVLQALPLGQYGTNPRPNSQLGLEALLSQPHSTDARCLGSDSDR